ncbi:MAG TPA: YncE family protein [Candidatus Dormibacteraeota bacterium]|nr:YncE family protein [Candidatus Dormibacteraeota bacterium]
MKKFSLSLLVFSFAFLGTVALASPPGPGYHLIKKVSLGAAPGGGEYFDYVTVDSAARRVYLSHGAEVKVLDADTFSVVGTISGLKRCHGVVVLPELGKGFITDGDAATVAVFDLKSLKITGKIKSSPDTDSITYDPMSKFIFTFNGDSKNSTVIDPVKETVVKVIDMGGAVEQPVADGKGTLYDNNEEKNDVAVVDTHALTIKARWPVAPAGTPVAMEMDREHRRLFSSGRNPQFLVVMDADNGKIVQSLPISSGVDANVFEPETGLLFVATRVGKLHVFHEDSPDKLTEVETVKTEFGAKTMGLDPKTHNLFLTTADFGPAPAPTKEKPHAERKPIRGTFRVLIYGR